MPRCFHGGRGDKTFRAKIDGWAWAVKKLGLWSIYSCATFLPLRLLEQIGKPIHLASVGFQPAGQHLSATNAKSSQSDRSPSDSSGGSSVLKRCLRPNKSDGERSAMQT